jgi:pyruvate,water dikinase
MNTTTTYSNKYYKTSISNIQVWNELAHSPKQQQTSLTNTQVIKIVWMRYRDTLQPNEYLYFINSQHYVYHYDFIKNVLMSDILNKFLGKLMLDIFDFNNRNYRENNRRQFVLLTLIRYGDIDKYALEIPAEDDLPVVELIELFSTIQNRVFFGDKLYFKPSSNLTERTANSALQMENTSFKVISTNEIYNGVQYMPYHTGSVYGYLKLLRESDMERPTITENDIVFADFVPNDIPPCAAIVTSVFQAPLCHVSILCQNRNTPNMYLKTVFNLQDSEQLSLTSGSFIQITVKSSSYTIANMDDKLTEIQKTQILEMQSMQTDVKRKPIDLPKIELPGLFSYCPKQCLLYTSWKREWCGEKANSLRELHSAWNNNVTDQKVHVDGFVIPFFAYFKHMEQVVAHLSQRGIVFPDSTQPVHKCIASWLKKEDSQATLSQKLGLLCSCIQQIPLDESVFQLIMKAVQQLNTSRVIMRSSTNAEDLVGFNGAGLYLSESVSCDDPDACKELVRRIWMSVWSEKAYAERALYKIDQSLIGMAILVQPFLSLDSETVKGVCLTHAPIRSDFGAIFINVQSISTGDVTDSKGNIPEQMVVYSNAGVTVQELISRSTGTDSNCTTDVTIMSDEQVELLYSAVKKLKKTTIFRSYNRKNCCADIEFLINRNNEQKYVLHILQVRPHLIQTVASPTSPISCKNQ